MTEWKHSLAKSALLYARAGYKVLPLRPDTKIPATQHGVHDATSDLSQVREWWRHNSKFNVGLACGDKFDVLDFDGPEAFEWFADKINKYGSTVRSKTRRGEHWYFQPFASGNGSLRALKLDIKTRGGQVVAPPSIVDGTTYQWINPLVPGGSLLSYDESLPTRSNVIQFPKRPRSQIECPTDIVTARLAPDWLEAMIAVATAKPGDRNDSLYWNAYYLYQWWWKGEVNERGIELGMTEAALKTGLEEEAIAATLRSAKRRVLKENGVKASG